MGNLTVHVLLVIKSFRYTFLKLINIQKPKTEKSCTVVNVFGYLMKNSSFLHPKTKSKSVCLTTYIKHSSQYFITISKNSKILCYASYFQLSSWCLISDETLCLTCLMYYIHVKQQFSISAQTSAPFSANVTEETNLNINKYM